MKKTKNNKSTAVATVEPVKAVPLTEDQAANAIRQQYQVVIRAEAATFRERVRFGGMLLQWERFLGESRGCKSAGEGLKGWLEKNCPEIGYTAALGYKALAGKAAKMIGGGTQAIAALQGRDTVAAPGTGEVIDVDSEIIEKREALFAEVDSRRKLEQAYFAFMAEEGRDGARPSRVAKRRGRKPGSNANSSGVDTHIAKTAAEKAAAAEQEMRELVGKLGAFLTRGGKINMLTAQAKSDFHTSLVDYAKLLEEQM